MDWLFGDAIKNFFINAAEDAIALFLEILTLVNGTTLQILENTAVQNIIIYAQAFGGLLISYNFVYQSWVNQTLRDDEDSPEALLKRTVVAVVIVTIAPVLAKQLFKLGQAVSNDIAGVQGIDTNIGSDLVFLTTVISQFSQYAIYIGLTVIVAIILLLIIFVQSLFRSVQFAFNVIMGCVMAAMHVSHASDHLGVWFRDIVAIAATPVIQMIGLKIAFSMMASSMFSTNSLFQLILFLVFLVSIIKLPNIVRQYVQSTGTGKTVVSATKSVTSMALRKMMMR